MLSVRDRPGQYGEELSVVMTAAVIDEGKTKAREPSEWSSLNLRAAWKTH